NLLILLEPMYHATAILSSSTVSTQAILGLLDLCNKLLTYEISECEQAINQLHRIYKNYKPPKKNKLSPPSTTTTTKST
ncbi:10404_t:CDS:2, partial [Racocetra persica]